MGSMELINPICKLLGKYGKILIFMSQSIMLTGSKIYINAIGLEPILESMISPNKNKKIL